MNNPKILIWCGLEDFGDMQSPGLANDRADRGVRVEQSLDIGIVSGLAASPAGRAKGSHQSVLPVEVADALEELGIFGIGAGPAAFDKGDAKLVEAPDDAKLIIAGEGDALTLGAVPQGRIIDLHDIESAEGSRHREPPRKRVPGARS